MKQRLETALVGRKLASSLRQAATAVTLGQVRLNGRIIRQAGVLVGPEDTLQLADAQRYVSRAGHKLDGANIKLGLNFKDKVVLDVGSSTGGFTDYALQHGARRVIAVEVGRDQLHPSLRVDPRIELHEQTDIRALDGLSSQPDIVLIDVSFVSLRDILPAVSQLVGPRAVIVAMVKPQFETGSASKREGVIKNDRLRRAIFKDFEIWIKNVFVVLDKADSKITGVKGNLERFYLLRLKP